MNDELMLNLIEQQKKYIKFLSKDYDAMASYLILHNWRWSEKTINKGVTFRETIRKLTKQLKDNP